jgi:mycothiol synthase
MMTIKMRTIQTEEDFWKIRTFLREVMLLNELRERSWHVARWDYWRWHGIANCGCPSLWDSVLIWETSGGEIAAVVNPEDRHNIYFQVHPKHRSIELEEEMLDAAEKHVVFRSADSKVHLRMHAHENDIVREKLFKVHGYSPTEDVETQHFRYLDRDIPEAFIPDGFTIRSLGDEKELPARSWASWRGFHPNEPPEKYEGWEWYLNIQHCPLYRRDLDLVAVAPNGDIASFTTIWYDDFTLTAYCEPVATHPEYLRMGLARACLTEGMHRLKQLGCVLAFVSSEEPKVHQVYHSIGFDEHEISRSWVKELSLG